MQPEHQGGVGVLDPVMSPPQTEQGDHDRFTHIVLEGWKPDDGSDFISTGSTVLEGVINGVPVKSLCGKIWVPGKPVSKYLICPTCSDIAKAHGWSV